ncbi:MAG: hypothetical protein ACPGVO_23630 [Spirulinaceae cyanobacterium]
MLEQGGVFAQSPMMAAMFGFIFWAFTIANPVVGAAIYAWLGRDRFAWPQTRPETQPPLESTPETVE